jgi:UDP-glucose 4-epimerase
VIRLSYVFGTTGDHQDRVMPAFAHAAVLGHSLRIDGAGHTFDFTHLEDVTRGITALIRLLQAGGEVPPPIYFVTGCPTTLGQLANMAFDIAGSCSSLMHAAPRNFDVAQCYGSPERARQLLGWLPHISLREGLT